jgi:2-keto-4-pentenoate hydratase
MDEAVARLDEAFTTRVPCAPVRDLLGSDDIAAAYRVQTALIALRCAKGAMRVGRKIGLTSPVVQKQLGVGQPDFGTLLNDMAVENGGVASVKRLVQPRVEGEIAFRLQHDLDGPIDRDVVRAAVAGASAAIEIVDSRIAGWDITITDTVADNASCGLFVVSDTVVPLTDAEPVEANMTLDLNGSLVSSGDGRACLGDPLTALEWLARTAAAFGDPLRAGELVLSGALGPMAPVEPGDRVRVEISGLGSVAVTFETE